MVTITFPDRETEKRALGFLLGRFSGRVLKSGEHLVPEAALEALAAAILGKPRSCLVTIFTSSSSCALSSFISSLREKYTRKAQAKRLKPLIQKGLKAQKLISLNTFFATVIGLPRIAALADQNIPFFVKGKSTYEQQIAAIRDIAPATI